MEISESILEEVRIFTGAVALGTVFAWLYDWNLILRRVFPHDELARMMEDGLFWLCVSLCSVNILFRWNRGVLQIFIILGALLGILLYKKSISCVYIKIMSNITQHVVVYIKRVTYIVLKPLTLLKKPVKSGVFATNRLVKISYHNVKNTLTTGIKRFTITLCKHKAKDALYQEQGCKSGEYDGRKKEKADA